jgi:hypothetical protein
MIMYFFYLDVLEFHADLQLTYFFFTFSKLQAGISQPVKCLAVGLTARVRFLVRVE